MSSVTRRNREASCRRNETSVSQMRLKPEPYVLRKDYLLTVWHSYHALRSLAIHIHMPQLLFSAGAGRCLARLIDYFVRKVGAPFTNICISIQVLQRIKCACVCVCLWKRKEGMFWCWVLCLPSMTGTFTECPDRWNSHQYSDGTGSPVPAGRGPPRPEHKLSQTRCLLQLTHAQTVSPCK